MTNDHPIELDFRASTSKYEVTWKIRVDYTVAGEKKTVWVQDDDDKPFHAVAARPDNDQISVDFQDRHWVVKP